MALEMTPSSGQHTSTGSASGAVAASDSRPASMQELAPPVYGPEPPPSMAQGRASSNAAVGVLRAALLSPDGGHEDLEARDGGMATITAKLQEAFQSQLLGIMAEHGYDGMKCSMQDIADVLFSLGLLGSPTDDVVATLGKHLQADLCKFMYDELQDMTRGAVRGRMARILTDPAACARDYEAYQRGEMLEYDSDDSGESGDSNTQEGKIFMKMFRGYRDVQREAERAEEGSPPPLPTDPVQPSAPTRDPSPEPVLPVDPVDPVAAESADKQQKTKKKRRRHRKKGKGRADDADEDGRSLSPARAEQIQSLQQPQQQHQVPARPVAAPGTARSLSGHAGAEAAHKRGVLPKLLHDGDGDLELDGDGDNIPEAGQIRGFWLSLSEAERYTLVMVEKGVVLARVRAQQNFSCGCNVCTRKREAIERELDSLYDSYYEVLRRNARKAGMQLLVVAARKKAQSEVLHIVEAFTDMVIDKLGGQSEEVTRKRVQQTIIDCIRGSSEAKLMFGPEMPKLAELESALQRSSLVDLDEDLLDFDEQQPQPPSPTSCDAMLKLKESLNQALGSRLFGGDIDDADANDNSGVGSASYKREMRQLFQSTPHDLAEPLSNGDLFYTEDMLDTIDTFPTDSKKFFDMMERMAEYRLQREDALLGGPGDDEMDVGYALHDSTLAKAWRAQQPALPPPPPLPLPLPQRRCPDCHGEISDTDDPQAYAGLDDGATGQYRSQKRGRASSQPESPEAGSISDRYDPRDGYDLDDDYDEDDELDDDLEDDLEDDLDETDDDYADLDPESAEREIESGRKVFQLFAARLFEQSVISAYREKAAHDMQKNLILELETEEKRSQAKDKRKQKRKEREKEKKRQIQQQREADRLAKEAQARAEEERRRQEAEQRVRDLEKRRRDESAKALKAQEERNRRILELADKRLEKERQEKLRIEQERAEKLRAERETREREAREREAREREAAEQARCDKEARKSAKQPAAAKQATRQRQPRATPAAPPVVSTKQPIVAAPAQQMPPPPTPPSSAGLVSCGPPPFPAAAPMANGIPTSSGIPLLDSLQRTPRLEPTSPFQAPRPSLPAVHLRDGSPAATGTPAFAQMRARANSGPNLQHPGVLPTAVPTMPVAPAPGVVDVPPEIDAEIASIVGRVMGAFTLEGDLVGGAEWRAGPAPELPKSLGIGLPSLAVGAGRPLAAGPDQGHRRNSMPMNHFAPPDSPATADDARATPPSRLAAVSENAFCPFGMQPPQTGSPLLPAASIPLGGLAAQPQAHPGFAPASSQCISLPSPFEQQQQQQHRMALGFAPPPPPPSLFLGAPGVHGSSVPFSVVPFQAPPLRTAVQPLTLPADPQAGYSMSYGPPFLTPDPWSPPKQTNGTAVQPQLHPLHMLARPTSTTQLHQQPQQQ